MSGVSEISIIQMNSNLTTAKQVTDEQATAVKADTRDKEAAIFSETTLPAATGEASLLEGDKFLERTIINRTNAAAQKAGEGTSKIVNGIGNIIGGTGQVIDAIIDNYVITPTLAAKEMVSVALGKGWLWGTGK